MTSEVKPQKLNITTLTNQSLPLYANKTGLVHFNFWYFQKNLHLLGIKNTTGKVFLYSEQPKHYVAKNINQ